MAINNYSVFKAIADPTRREIIHLLATANHALSINDISSKFRSSRQAVTKHIKLLKKAGLIQIEKKGREKYCQVEVTPLKEVYDWVLFYETFWSQKLSALESYLADNSKDNSN